MVLNKQYPFLLLVIFWLYTSLPFAYAQLETDNPDSIEGRRAEYGEAGINDLLGIGIALAGTGLVSLPLWALQEDLPPTLSHGDLMMDIAMLTSAGVGLHFQPSFAAGRFFSHAQIFGLETLLRARISESHGLAFSEFSYRGHLRILSALDDDFHLGISLGPGFYYDGSPRLSIPASIRLDISNFHVGLVLEHTQFLIIGGTIQEQSSVSLFPKRLIRGSNIFVGLAYHLYTEAFSNPVHGIAIQFRVLRI
ncbi:MAG: hypothetical protein R3A45_04290 [Bdellovibrionota bacterium]